MEQRVVVQLAVLASFATIGTFIWYGIYRKKQQQQRLSDAEERKHAQKATAFVDPTASKEVAHNAPKQPKKEAAPAPTSQKKTQEKPPAATAPAAVNVGQEEATLATKKYKAGAYEEAIELYSLAIKQCEVAVPVDVRNLKVMYSNRAAAYERLEDHENVIQDCTKALKLDKRHPKAYLRRAKAKAATGDYGGALVDYVCLLVISEEKQEQVDESLATEIARIHTEVTAKEIEDAKQNKQNPKRYLPDQFFITSYYSSFHVNDDENDLVAEKSAAEYSADLEALGDSASVQRERAELLTLRALALKKEKEYERAAQDLDAACALVQREDPAYYTVQIENGTYHHLRGEFEAAQKCFEEALVAKPESVFAKIRMGGLCFDQKDLKKALEWFDMVLAEKSNCSTAYFHRGQLHSIDMQPDGSPNEASVALAFHDLEKCISLTPDFSMAYIQLGVTHARSGNFQGAIEYLTTAARITPNVPEIYNYLGETYMQMAQMPSTMVEEMFDKAIELDPTYPMAYINKGNLLVQKGAEHGLEAVALFEKAAEMCPRSKFAYCHLAQVYMAMQEYGRAIEQIDKAVVYAFSNDELQELFAIRVTAETHLQAKILMA